MNGKRRANMLLDIPIFFLSKMLLKKYAANFHVHHSRVRKQVKLSGSCLSTIYGFGSTQLSETLMSYRRHNIFLTK